MDKKILIPLDGSETAETILPLVCMLASDAESELILLHVVEYPCELYPVCRDDPPADPDLAEMKKRAVLCDRQAYLDEVSARLTRLGYNVHTRICEGLVVESIVDAAQYLDAHFIAVSTHGSGRYRREMTGSVANRVLHEAKTPVMVIVCPYQELFQIDPEMMRRAVFAEYPVKQDISS
ncbi:MAG TPA: universal stress protein [Anaerolineales bacterium]|nr:universal stress protein [Anaerolineales bacterium]